MRRQVPRQRPQRRDLRHQDGLRRQPVPSLPPCVPRPLRQARLQRVPALRQDQALRLGHCRREIAVRYLLGIVDLFLMRLGNRARAVRVPGSRCVHSNPAKGGHSRLDPLARAARVVHNPGLLNSVAARCPPVRVPAHVRPGVRGCCHPFQRNCLRRRSRGSRFTHESRPSASAPFWISASNKVSANCTRRGSVLVRAGARPLRSSPRRSPVRRAM